jgi:hypothetical protein
MMKKIVKNNDKLIFCMFLVLARAVAGKKMVNQGLVFYPRTDDEMSMDSRRSIETIETGGRPEYHRGL